MTDREKILLRYVCDGDIKHARQQAKIILEETKTQKDERFRAEMLRRLEAKKSFVELPPNLQGILEAEDSEIFPERKFLLRDGEKAITEQLLNVYRAADKLSKIGLSYLPALIIHGKSGCGKTELARYIAHKAKLPFVYVRFSSLVDSHLGATQSNVAKVFDYAKSAPCVLCFDEIDAIGLARGQDQDVGEMNRIVIALMQEMDRLPNNVIVIGTTNRFDRLDQALVRRFPLQYEVEKLSADEAEALSKQIFQYAGLDPAWFPARTWNSTPASRVVWECVNAIVSYIIANESNERN